MFGRDLHILAVFPQLQLQFLLLKQWAILEYEFHLNFFVLSIGVHMQAGDGFGDGEVVAGHEVAEIGTMEHIVPVVF